MQARKNVILKSWIEKIVWSINNRSLVENSLLISVKQDITTLFYPIKKRAGE